MQVFRSVQWESRGQIFIFSYILRKCLELGLHVEPKNYTFLLKVHIKFFQCAELEKIQELSLVSSM